MLVLANLNPWRENTGMFNHGFILRLRYEIWPPVKVRCKYYWWIVRYRGKRNIPKEVVFRSLTKSLERMNNALDSAYQLGAHDMGTSGEEIHQVLSVKTSAAILTEKVNRLSEN